MPRTADDVCHVKCINPERIARTGQKLGLTSDARSRFERGVDPAFLEAGIRWRRGAEVKA